jgi:hypothetical protein
MKRIGSLSHDIFVIGLIIGLGILPGQSVAQEVAVTSVPEDPTCPRCTVRLTTLATLAVPNSGGRPAALPSRVSLDSKGRIWLFGEGVPSAFDPNGRKIGEPKMMAGRAIGFRNPTDAIAVGDSIIVLDQTSQVAAVFGPDLVESREMKFALPLIRAKVIRWPDFVVGVGLLPLAEARGWPLHRISLAGGEATILSSFGSGKGQLRAATAEINDQRIAPVDASTFWSFLPTRYRLARWDSTLRTVEILVRRPAWFSDSGQALLGSPTTPPSAVVNSIQADSAGHLWVFISVPSETWPTAWPPRRPGLSEIAASAIAYERLYRTAVEVLDANAKRVLTRIFTDYWVLTSLPGNRALVVSSDASGNRRLSLVSLALDRGDPSLR